MADPNQTSERGDWACPCNGCQKAVSWERKELIQTLLTKKSEYLVYRGSSFDDEGNLMWAKDDALAYSEGIDMVIKLIEDRTSKRKNKQQ